MDGPGLACERDGSSQRTGNLSFLFFLLLFLSLLNWIDGLI